MRFRSFVSPLLLLLLTAVSLLVAPAPIGAQTAPEPSLSDGVRIARPRGAILTLFHSGAESFLLEVASSVDRPVQLPEGSPIRLHADYEAVLMPLTAGFVEYELQAYLLTDTGRELLSSDEADVVAFGPARRAGRLGLRFELKPGLHRIGLVATTRTRAVGVSEWSVDTDDAQIWILVGAGGVAPIPGPRPAPLPAPLPAPQVDAVHGLDQSAARPAPELPVGGLGTGAQRGMIASEALGALNFETGTNTTLRARVGDIVRVWSDYEVWWTEGAWAAATVELTVRRSATAGSAAEALGSDRAHVSDGVGPRLEDGTLDVGLTFDRPGTYRLAAHMTTLVQRGDEVSRDADVVPFTVHVIGDPPTTGNIAGQVWGVGTEADPAGILPGAPLEGVTVLASDKDGRVHGRARTNADGRYMIEGLEPGDYIVHGAPAPLNFLDQWWRGSNSPRGAEPVTVAVGRTTDGILFRLMPGATIAGRVTSVEGRPLGDIEITLGPVGPDGGAIAPREPGDTTISASPYGRTKTNDDGYYAIDRLPTGRYWVRARDPEGRHMTEYFDDALLFSEADPVPAGTGEVVGDIDFELAVGGAITGQVREQTDLTVIIPLGGMLIEARNVDSPDHVMASTSSNDDGLYRLGALAPGRYLVRASSPSGSHLHEWYREAMSPADAEPVGVEDGEVTPEINFTLSPAEHNAVVFIDPEHTSGRVGTASRFTVAARDVENLGAFEAAVEWNPEILKVNEVVLGDFLGSTGRETIPVEPMIDNREGRLSFAAASLGDGPGPSGGGVLFTVVFVPIAEGETRLTLAGTILTGPRGRDIAHETKGGSVRVGGCMFGDFDCNCRIDIRDVMAVIVRWGMVEGDPDWDPLYDLNTDGRINIVDVQIEAGLWGTVCPTGTSPLSAGDFTLRADSPSSITGSGGDVMTEAGASSVDSMRHMTGADIIVNSDQEALLVGERVTISLDVSGAVDLAAFEATLGYDAEKLMLMEATLGDFLGSTGRTVTQLGPEVGDGLVSIAAFGLPGAAAPSGSGQLATLTFEAIATGSTSLQVIDGALVDSLNEATSVAGGTATLEIGAPRVTMDAFVPFVTRGW